MKIYIVYEWYGWYADSDYESCQFSYTKDVVVVYDSLDKAEAHIVGKDTEMKYHGSMWYTIEEHEVL